METTREERLLSNSTLQYQLTGLTSTTPYTIQVAALTAAGRGTVTSSTVSTGVPPGMDTLDTRESLQQGFREGDGQPARVVASKHRLGNQPSRSHAEPEVRDLCVCV